MLCDLRMWLKAETVELNINACVHGDQASITGSGSQALMCSEMKAIPLWCKTVSSALSQAWMLCTRTWASWSRGCWSVWISWVTLRCASCSVGCRFTSWSPKRCCRSTSTPYWRKVFGRSEHTLHSYCVLIEMQQCHHGLVWFLLFVKERDDSDVRK